MNKEISRNVWIIVIKISEVGRGELVLGTVYHSPSKSDAVLIDTMNNVADMLMQYDKVIVLGDFNLNVDINKRDYYATKLIKYIEFIWFKAICY